MTSEQEAINYVVRVVVYAAIGSAVAREIMSAQPPEAIAATTEMIAEPLLAKIGPAPEMDE